MKAMVLRKISNLEVNNSPLRLVDMKEPVPGEKEILVRVTRCGVCHTELDEIEGRTPPLRLPVILGHQVVGKVEEVKEGSEASKGPEAPKVGQRVGVAWIASACG